jgi:hypothetical protein
MPADMGVDPEDPVAITGCTILYVIVCAIIYLTGISVCLFIPVSPQT